MDGFKSRLGRPEDRFSKSCSWPSYRNTLLGAVLAAAAPVTTMAPWAVGLSPSRHLPPATPPTELQPQTRHRRQGATWAVPANRDRSIISRKLLGRVKWFNIRNGYGFINSNDTKEGVFARQPQEVPSQCNR